MITVISQDILATRCDIIANQVNCQGVMGAGLALQIRKTHPEVYTAYRKYCPNSDLLGKIQVVRTNTHLVANLFAQDKYGRDRQYTDYKALKQCFIKLRDYAINNNLHSIALPYGIGCGLAGGSWDTVSKIIKDVFNNTSLIIYICKKEA